MGNELSTVGGAIATVGTSVAAGVTFGQVEALNNAVKDCAGFTADKASQTIVRHAGETVVHATATASTALIGGVAVGVSAIRNDLEAATGAVATAATAVAAGVTFGQVEALNNAVKDCAAFTADKASDSLTRHAGETAVNAAAIVGTSVAAGVTMGQVEALNDAVTESVERTCQSAQATATRVEDLTKHEVKMVTEVVKESAERTGRSAVTATTEALVAADSYTDAIPLVGHAKGALMYACDKKDRGDRAMKAASRTTAVIGGGLGGFVVGGPVGAVAGGLAGGAAMDGVTTGFDSLAHGEFRPNGYVAAWHEGLNGGDKTKRIQGFIDATIMMPAFDAMGGRGSPNLVQQYKTGGVGRVLEPKLKPRRLKNDNSGLEGMEDFPLKLGEFGQEVGRRIIEHVTPGQD